MVRKMLAILGTGLAAVMCLALGYRAWQQSQASDRLQIQQPAGIDEAAFVPIGGIDQWITVRGEDRSNPVLLLIHGGPGSSLLPISYDAFREWEKHYTVVQWDQRGSGRTFGKNDGDAGKPTLQLLISDGIEVAKWARAKLKQDKVTLVAHSMGTIVGTEMARRAPELFHAYIGTGQIFDMPANETVGYQELLQRVRDAKDKGGEAKLVELGPPPYEGNSPLLAERSVLRAHPPESEASINGQLIKGLFFYPSYSLGDVIHWIRAQQFSIEALLPEMMAYRLDTQQPFMVPMIFIQGDQDIQTPTSLVGTTYVDIDAPRKELILVKGGGHSAILAMPKEFLRALDQALRTTRHSQAARFE